jgi:hypothetical protein
MNRYGGTDPVDFLLVALDGIQFRLDGLQQQVDAIRANVERMMPTTRRQQRPAALLTTGATEVRLTKGGKPRKKVVWTQEMRDKKAALMRKMWKTKGKAAFAKQA